MVNVLPPDAQKRVWALQRSRFLLVLSAVMLVLSAVAGISLIPSYVALEIATDTTSTTQGKEETRTEGPSLGRSQALVQELMPSVMATSSPVEVVMTALSLKPAGVKVNRIMYAAGEEDKITLLGSGSRELVSAYKDALVKSGRYTGVSVPVGALVGSDGGGFSILLSGQF